MAATDFKNSKYETNGGLVVKIRVDTATLTANAPPAGDVDLGVSAYVNKGRRAYGIHARGVRLIDEGATATEKDKLTFVPILTKSVWDGLSEGAAYAPKPGYNVLAKVEEKLR